MTFNSVNQEGLETFKEVLEDVLVEILNDSDLTATLSSVDEIVEELHHRGFEIVSIKD